MSSCAQKRKEAAEAAAMAMAMAMAEERGEGSGAEKEGVPEGELAKEEPDGEEEAEESESDEAGPDAGERSGDGEGAGDGDGRPKSSTGMRTWSMEKMLTGKALWSVLVTSTLFHSVKILTTPLTKVTLSVYLPPIGALKEANVDVTVSLVSCRSVKEVHWLRPWYSRRLLTWFASVKFLRRDAAGSDVKALLVGAKMLMPLLVSLACRWNSTSTPDCFSTDTNVA